MSISAVTQEALRATLASADTGRWTDHLDQQPSIDLSPELMIRALDDARAEFGD